MSKRTHDFLSLQDAMKEMLTEHNLNKGITKVEVKQAWEVVMGNGVKSYTNQIEFKNGMLIINLSSAALREELSYGKDKIVTMLNAHLGSAIINNIKLT